MNRTETYLNQAHELLRNLQFDPVGRYMWSEGSALSDLVNRQAGAGLLTSTSGIGHHRANMLMEAFDGVELRFIDSGRIYQQYPSMTEVLSLSGRISCPDNHPALECFDALQRECRRVGTMPKMTLPAPATMLAHLVSAKEWDGVYGSVEEMSGDVASAYADLLDRLFEHGCRLVQFDDTSWAKLTDRNGIKLTLQGGVDVERFMDMLVSVNNAAMARVDKAMVKLLYVDRRCFTTGMRQTMDYSFIAPKLLGGVDVDGFYLDMNVDASNDFSFLRYLAPSKKVMLGLVPPIGSFGERTEFIARNLEEASEFCPMSQLGVTSCFSTNLPLMPFEDVNWELVADTVRCVRRVFATVPV